MAEEFGGTTSALGTSEQGQSQASETVDTAQTTPSVTTQTSDAKPQVNLFESPEFRKYQASYDAQIARMQAEVQRLQAAQHEQAMSGMDDLERTQYQLKLKDQEVQQYRMTLQEQQIAAQKQADINRLSSMSGAPAAIFEAAETYDDAVKLALEYQRQNNEQARAAREQKLQANRVDLGGGGASTPVEREKTEAERLLKSGDSMGFYKLILGG